MPLLHDRVFRRRPAFWLLAYALMMLFVGTTIPTPLYRIYQAEMHFSSGVLVLVFAVYVFTLLPALLVCGRVSDRVGRRPVLLAGFAVAACGAAVFATGRGLAWLFVGRALQGIATGITAGTATAALAELEPGRNTDKAALVASATNVGGAALGPVIGGLFAQYGSWPTVLPYLAYLVMMVPIVGLAAIPETVVRSRPLALTFGRPDVPRAIRREFAFAAATSFTVWAATALFLTLAPSYVATVLHLGNRALGGGVVFLMLGSSALAQMIGRKLPFRSAITGGLVLLPVGLAGVVLAAPLQSAWLMVTGTVLAGAGQGQGFMGSLTLLNRITPRERRGDVTSSFYVASYLGVALPALAVGFGAESVGLFTAVAILSASVGVVALGLAAAFVRSPFASR
ncbi:MAG: MFS transporter [Pseudomonadota bacterium]|nr:MFS transporter [Pseudomonadota bacterium]